MAAVIEAQRQPGTRLILHQAQAFFAWRYQNPARKYVFYFLRDGQGLRGYLAISVSPNNRHAEMLDYGERDRGALREILGYINRRMHFTALSIFSYGTDERSDRSWRSALLDRSSAQAMDGYERVAPSCAAHLDPAYCSTLH